MGFEVYLHGDPSQTGRLPTKADIEAVFAGLVRVDEVEFTRLVVGPSETESCGIYYSDDDPQAELMIERPVDGDWLWDRLFRLLDDYDLYMFWPDEEIRAVVAREEVPVLEDLAAEKVIVRSGHALRASIA